MKKYYISILITSVLLFTFISCTPKKVDTKDKIKILCTYFPQYDWTRSITGGLENETINTLLIKNGVDFHFYKPDQMDIEQLSDCNLLIYIGGPSENWISEELSSMTNPPEVINLYKVIEEETLSKPEDEHIWLSFEYAQICSKAIYNTLIKLVPQNSEKYKDNFEEYMEQIQSLQASYKIVINKFPDKPLILCDRFPFHYLAKGFNLNFLSALPDCNTNLSASQENITFLANQLNENNLKNILILDDSDKKISKAVILAAKKPGCDTFILDSMQCTSLRESMGSTTYLDAMRKNLEVLQKYYE